MTQENLLMIPEISVVILLLPLLGFLFNIFFGKRIGRLSSTIATGIMGICLALASYIAFTKFVYYPDNGMIQLKFDWFTLGPGNAVSVGIGVDNMTAMMLVVVTLISFLVHLFSTEYMRDDKRYSRFFAYLGIFTFSMLGIVIANNFLFMYIFWELVGLSSYLLIGFWYEKDSAANASKKAFITNRVGDLGFFAGIMILFFTYRTFFFDDIFAKILGDSLHGIAPILPFNSGFWLTVAGILIFCGAIGKSAQFPLHIWLPDAMEGPTPVSALIHAATMVAAGVYLTARVFPMFTAHALLFVAYTGAITAFLAATIAITQNDFKKVLAYSTVSQLGYMVMGIGVGAFTNGFFHLVTHAWFKACLFLASGSVIHAMHHAMHHLNDHHTDPQDIRNMGGLRKTMPLTYLTFLFATIAISGVPFTSGFLSKDGILAGTLAFAQLTGNWLIPIAGFGAAGMTAFYMFRLTIEAFHGVPKTKIATQTKENKFVIVFPLVLLAVMSFWFFYSANPIDASKGWFASRMKAPATSVPTAYQFRFLVPEERLKQEEEAQEKLEKANVDENTEKLKKRIHEELEIAYATGQENRDSVEKYKQEFLKNKEEAKARARHPLMAKKSMKDGSGEKEEFLTVFEEKIEEAHLPAMFISVLIAGLGILLSFTVYQFKAMNSDNLANQFGLLYRLSYNKWYIDEIYDASVIWFTLNFSKVLGLFDLKVIDGIVNLTAWVARLAGQATGIFDNVVVDGLVNLIANVTGTLGSIMRKFQTGRVQTYIGLTIVVVILLVYFLA
ncbi:MAG: NADH-quinone oxidoreductase subunit L [Candidatus Kapabacteria bacterium]|nr:NADH-quinone oxidoreductase subunit L [Candidatus Kapabacteria bacterium]